MASKIPANAKKVFEGIIFDVWQWPQEMFDGSVQTFERISRPGSVVVLATDGNKILLNYEEQPGHIPFKSFPAGRIEREEDPLAGAKRELLEETGYASDDWLLFEEGRGPSLIEWEITVFCARNVKKITEPGADPGEKIISEWKTLDELIALAEDSSFRAVEMKWHFLKAHYDPEYKKALAKRIFG